MANSFQDLVPQRKEETCVGATNPSQKQKETNIPSVTVVTPKCLSKKSIKKAIPKEGTNWIKALHDNQWSSFSLVILSQRSPNSQCEYQTAPIAMLRTAAIKIPI